MKIGDKVKIVKCSKHGNNCPYVRFFNKEGVVVAPEKDEILPPGRACLVVELKEYPRRLFFSPNDLEQIK